MPRSYRCSSSIPLVVLLCTACAGAPASTPAGPRANVTADCNAVLSRVAETGVERASRDDARRAVSCLELAERNEGRRGVDRFRTLSSFASGALVTVIAIAKLVN